jgi:hypothetical protein
MTVLEEGGGGVGLVATVSPPLQLRTRRSVMLSSTSSTAIRRNSCGATLTAKIFPRMRIVILKSSARTSTICSSTFPRSDPEKVMQHAGTVSPCYGTLLPAYKLFTLIHRMPWTSRRFECSHSCYVACAAEGRFYVSRLKPVARDRRHSDIHCRRPLPVCPFHECAFPRKNPVMVRSLHGAIWTGLSVPQHSPSQIRWPGRLIPRDLR